MDFWERNIPEPKKKLIEIMVNNENKNNKTERRFKEMDVPTATKINEDMIN
tara:strand:+ start:770 stop:922 length:153 start_codon:yes stop_codon:yes gene_type:complete